MSRTTRDLWLEDRRGVLDRRRDNAWWGWLRWVLSIGLVSAVAHWGWRIPLAVGVAVTAAVFVAFARPLSTRPGPVRRGRLSDTALLTGLATVGAAGLIALVGPWALLLLLLLTVTSPVMRRAARDRRALLRCYVALARDARLRRPPYSSESDGWP